MIKENIYVNLFPDVKIVYNDQMSIYPRGYRMIPPRYHGTPIIRALLKPLQNHILHRLAKGHLELGSHDAE